MANVRCGTLVATLVVDLVDGSNALAAYHEFAPAPKSEPVLTVIFPG